MPIQAQSADGVIHEFPDGTPDSVVDGAMRNYAATAGGPKAVQAAPPAPKGILGNVSGFMANLNRGLGIGDELAAGANTGINLMTGKIGFGDIPSDFTTSMGKQRALEDGYAGAHPTMAALGRGTGNVGLAVLPIGPGAEAFAGGNLMTNAVRGATTGGLTAAGYAAADRGTLKQRMTAAGSAAHDPVALGLGAVAGGIATPRSRPTAAPSLEDLTTAKSAAYKAVDDSGVTIPPEDFAKLQADMAGAMDDAGFHAGLHPKAASMMQKIGDSAEATPGYSPTLSQLDQLRQNIGRDVAGANDPGERRMGQIMRGKIDDYIANLPGGEDLTTARDLNTRVQKLRTLDGLDDSASDRASVTGSGGNGQNTSRQNIVRFKNQVGNLTPDEQAATQTAIDGTPVQNALRMVGKLSPEGNGLALMGHGAMTTAELASGHPSVAMAQSGMAVGGALAKRVSDAMATRNVTQLRDLIARGGDAAQAVSRQLEDPIYADLKRQVANDLAVQAGIQGASRRGPVSVEVVGHPELGTGYSSPMTGIPLPASDQKYRTGT